MKLGLGLGFSSSAQTILSEIFTLPLGFDWSPSFAITKQSGHYKTDIDVASLAPAGQAYYVDPVSGSDGNAGTEIAPFKSVRTAMNASNAVEVYLKSGATFLRDTWTGYGAYAPPRDMSFKTYGGTARCYLTTAQHALSWSLQTGTTYRVSRTNTQNVIDRSDIHADGAPKLLTYKSSIEEVDLSPGSWWTNGTLVYVNTFDSRVPDNDIMVMVDVPNLVVTGDKDMYFENIEFWGGDYPLAYNVSDGTKHCVLNNCAVRYSAVADGLTIRDVDRLTLIKSDFTDNFEDGVNIRTNGSTIVKTLEVDCYYARNGLSDAENINNGSTYHTGCLGIRLNCHSEDNKGPLLADSDVGTQSINLNCTAINSAHALSTDVGNAGFFVQNSAEMWLKNCKASGSYYDRSVNSAGIIYDLGGFSGDGLDNGSVTLL